MYAHSHRGDGIIEALSYPSAAATKWAKWAKQEYIGMLGQLGTGFFYLHIEEEEKR